MNWNKYRDADGNIDLVRIYNEEYNWVWQLYENPNTGENVLIETQQIHPIQSRQAAAVALGTALAVAKGEK